MRTLLEVKTFNNFALFSLNLVMDILTSRFLRNGIADDDEEKQKVKNEK